jgi:hypothetical protein
VCIREAMEKTCLVGALQCSEGFWGPGELGAAAIALAIAVALTGQASCTCLHTSSIAESTYCPRVRVLLLLFPLVPMGDTTKSVHIFTILPDQSSSYTQSWTSSPAPSPA